MSTAATHHQRYPEAITTVRGGGPRREPQAIDCRAEGVPARACLGPSPEWRVLPAYYGNRITIHHERNPGHQERVDERLCSWRASGATRAGGPGQVQLTVLEPRRSPFHDPVTVKITAMAGHTISLNCSATVPPTPWRCQGALPNGTELRRRPAATQVLPQGDGRLHVSGLSSEDAGATAAWRNAAGHTERLCP